MRYIVYKAKLYKAYTFIRKHITNPFHGYKIYEVNFNMKDDESYEEEVYSESSEDDDESSLVEDDEISAEEEGFMRGYEEADTPSKQKEVEEEELE